MFSGSSLLMYCSLWGKTRVNSKAYFCTACSLLLLFMISTTIMAIFSMPGLLKGCELFQGQFCLWILETRFELWMNYNIWRTLNLMRDHQSTNLSQLWTVKFLYVFSIVRFIFGQTLKMSSKFMVPKKCVPQLVKDVELHDLLYSLTTSTRKMPSFVMEMR